MKNELFGVIKLGQLKRIQAVLHKNWNQEIRFKNKNKNKNWNKEIEFIKKGRGQLIPVTICVDLLAKISDYQNTGENSIKTKQMIENLLKFRLLQNAPITCQSLNNNCNFQK